MRDKKLFDEIRAMKEIEMRIYENNGIIDYNAKTPIIGSIKKLQNII